jgi:rhodanese-related sulfurtransferase
MRYRASVLLLGILLIVAGCSQNSDKAAAQKSNPLGSSHIAAKGFKSISPADAVKLMKERKDLLVVDVRTPQELRNGRIDGSVLIPMWEILQGKRSLPKDGPILLVCAVGGRSYGVGQILEKKGWPEIYNLSGGLARWKREGYPVKY